MKEAHKSEDIAAIDTAMEELNAAWTAASQDLYAAQQEGAAGAEGANPEGDTTADAGGSAESDDVEDVEFEEVDDKA